MTPEEFTTHLRELVQQGDWQGVLDWYDAHYPSVQGQLSEDERDAVESGAVHTATVVLEARRRRLLAEAAAKRELSPAA